MAIETVSEKGLVLLGCGKMGCQVSNVLSFIPFLVFGFWSLLAMKLRKYENLCLHFTRQDGQNEKKKTERKSCN